MEDTDKRAIVQIKREQKEEWERMAAFEMKEREEEEKVRQEREREEKERQEREREEREKEEWDLR